MCKTCKPEVAARTIGAGQTAIYRRGSWGARNAERLRDVKRDGRALQWDYGIRRPQILTTPATASAHETNKSLLHVLFGSAHHIWLEEARYHGCTGAATAAVADITASCQIVVQANPGEAAVAFGTIVICHSGLAYY